MKHYREMAKAGHAAKVRAMGGKVKASHDDAAADKDMIAGLVKKGALKGDVAKIEGRAMGGRLDKAPRGNKHKGKAQTNITIAVMPKADAAPGADMGAKPPMPMPAPGPMMAGPKSPMPMPPPAPGPMSPAGPMGAKKGGVIKRAKGGTVKREDGGAVDEDASDKPIQVAGKFSGMTRGLGAVSKGASGAAKVAPKVVPKAPSIPSGRDVGNVIRETEALMNGTPGAPIGTGRRAIWDGLNLMTRRKPSDQQKDDPNQQPPQKRAKGGNVKMTGGAEGGLGRLQKAAAYGKKAKA